MTATLFQRARPGIWSYVALVLAGIGVVAATWLVVSTPTDPAGVRWWLVVAPVALAAVPLVAPTRASQLLATTLQALWCFVTGFSIGFLLLPALAAHLLAVTREDG